ncbi:hypothetical protein ACFQZC_31205 [Streptacidiphilus monticola]
MSATSSATEGHPAPTRPARARVPRARHRPALARRSAEQQQAGLVDDFDTLVREAALPIVLLGAGSEQVHHPRQPGGQVVTAGGRGGSGHARRLGSGGSCVNQGPQGGIWRRQNYPARSAPGALPDATHGLRP